MNSKIETTQTYYKQSANTLFYYTSKLNYLWDILNKMTFIPRYCVEDIKYLNFTDLDGKPIDSIAFPMVCFCDIKLHMIGKHKEEYGSFAIGLKKDWGERRNIQPIQYINPNSVYCEQITKSYVKLMKNSMQEEITDFFMSFLFHSKPLMGVQKGNIEKYINFHDEKEWRYVPFNIEFPDDFTFMEMNPDDLWKTSQKGICDSLKLIPEIQLKFDADDLNYIIVEKEEDSLEIWNRIEKLPLQIEEKRKLYSKIEVMEKIERDW